MKREITVPSPDGNMRAFAFTPDQGAGPWPAVLMFMDAPGPRPSLFEICEQLASHGYYVVMPDVFWRAGPYGPEAFFKMLGGDQEAAGTFHTLMGSTSPDRQMADVKACLDWLAAQPEATTDKVGVTGYCLGGAIALRAAGAFPDRVAASASFHPGGMVTDDEQSPHRLAPKIRAKVLVAGADQDSFFEPAHKEQLAAALKDAKVDAEVSIWEGCIHGWVPRDMPAHNPAGAERHWQKLIKLFDGALKPAVAA